MSREFVEFEMIESFKADGSEFTTPRAIALDDINYFQPKNKYYNEVKKEIMADIRQGLANSPKDHRLFKTIDRTIIRMENKYIIEVDATYSEVLKIIKGA